MAYAALPTVTAGQVATEAWANQTKANFDASPNAVVTTPGDTLYATGAGAFARRAIGSAGQVLTVSGGVPTWAAPAAVSGIVNSQIAVAAAIARSKLQADSYAVAYRTTDLSVPNTTETTITLNGEVADPLGWHDPGTNTERITPTIAGLAIAIAAIGVQGNATGVRTIHLKLNGGDVGRVDFVPGPSTVCAIAVAIRPVNGSTDYFSMSLEQNSGGALNALNSLTALTVAVL